MSERRRYEINPSFADLFTTQEDRDEAKLEKVQMLPLGELNPFPDHPFEVRDDEEMEKLVDSIRVHGVLMPAIARTRPDGSYELVAGHRRKRACDVDSQMVYCFYGIHMVSFVWHRTFSDKCACNGASVSVWAGDCRDAFSVSCFYRHCTRARLSFLQAWVYSRGCYGGDELFDSCGMFAFGAVSVFICSYGIRVPFRRKTVFCRRYRQTELRRVCSAVILKIIHGFLEVS